MGTHLENLCTGFLFHCLRRMPLRPDFRCLETLQSTPKEPASSEERSPSQCHSHCWSMKSAQTWIDFPRLHYWPLAQAELRRSRSLTKMAERRTTSRPWSRSSFPLHFPWSTLRREDWHHTLSGSRSERFVSSMLRCLLCRKMKESSRKVQPATRTP